MAVSNPIHVNSPGAAGAMISGGGRRRSNRKGSMPIGAGLFVAGAVLLYIMLAPAGETKGAIKFPLCLVAIALLYTGVDRFMKGLKGDRFDTGLKFCMGWLILIIGSALLADLLPLQEHENTTKTLAIKGNKHPDLFSKNPLGTNNFSLDILARCIYGARVSLLTAFFAVAIAFVIGCVIGMMAGYFRGWLDTIVSVLADTVLAFPALILLVAVITVLGRPSGNFEAIWKIGASLAVVALPTMTRIARANTLVFAQREFVLSARAMGAKNWRIIFREIAPNVVLPMLSYAFILIAALIVAEGSLSFIGLGLKQPKPTWGNMVLEGSQANVLKKHPHLAITPGIVMFLTVYSFNRVGEWARAIWDPRDLKI